MLGAGRAARVASVSPAAHAQPAAPPWCVDRPALGWPPAADASAVAPLPPTATHRAVLVAVCYLQVVPPVSSRPPRPPLPGAASGAHAAAAPRRRRAVAPPRGWLRWPPDRASPLGHNGCHRRSQAGSCVAAAIATLPSHPRSNADAASFPPLPPCAFLLQAPLTQAAVLSVVDGHRCCTVWRRSSCRVRRRLPPTPARRRRPPPMAPTIPTAVAVTSPPQLRTPPPPQWFTSYLPTRRTSTAVPSPQPSL